MVVIPSVLVSIVAIWIIVFILKSIVPRRILDIGSLFRRREVTKHGARLDGIERLIKGGFQRQFATELSGMFPLFIPTSEEQLGAIEVLNGRALALLLAASEKFEVSLEVLPVVEGLLQVRQEALQALLEAESRFREKKASGGLPGWGADEFKRKLNELRDRIKINERAIRDQMRGVREEFESLKSTTEVVH